MTIVEKPSPNFGPRPVGTTVRCLVLHADASSNEQGTISWVQSAASGVSYHYLIGRGGTVYRFVADDHRAWHAGKSEWHGVLDVNDFSIGVSFSNDQRGEAFTTAALKAGTQLCADLILYHALVPSDAVLATHAEVARPPGRKIDPGALFPLARFRNDVRALCAPTHLADAPNEDTP